jgi:hypothetical protein
VLWISTFFSCAFVLARVQLCSSVCSCSHCDMQKTYDWSRGSLSLCTHIFYKKCAFFIQFFFIFEKFKNAKTTCFLSVCLYFPYAVSLWLNAYGKQLVFSFRFFISCVYLFSFLLRFLTKNSIHACASHSHLLTFTCSWHVSAQCSVYNSDILLCTSMYLAYVLVRL